MPCAKVLGQGSAAKACAVKQPPQLREAFYFKAMELSRNPKYLGIAPELPSSALAQLSMTFPTQEGREASEGAGTPTLWLWRLLQGLIGHLMESCQEACAAVTVTALCGQQVIKCEKRSRCVSCESPG